MRIGIFSDSPKDRCIDIERIGVELKIAKRVGEAPSFFRRSGSGRKRAAGARSVVCEKAKVRFWLIECVEFSESKRYWLARMIIEVRMIPK